MTKDRARTKAAQYLLWADGREKKLAAMRENFNRDYGSFDWTEPIKIGHHSERRHRKIFERRDSFFRTTIDLEASIKRMREKAENLLIFANTNKGDAAKRHQERRDAISKILEVGQEIPTLYGMAKVLKINTKTVRVQTGSGWITLIDKSLLARMQ